MKIKYSICLFCLCLILFIVCCFSAIGTTYAYSSLPVMNKSIKFEYNLGYTSFGYNSSSASAFTDCISRPSYNNSFLSFSVRTGLDFTDINSLNGVIGYNITPLFQCRNEYYALGGAFHSTRGSFDSQYYYNDSLSIGVELSNISNNFVASVGVPTQLYNYNVYDDYVFSYNAFGLRFYSDNVDLSNYDIINALCDFQISSVEIGSSNNWTYGSSFGSQFASGRFNYVIYRDSLGWSLCYGFGAYQNNGIWLWDYRYYSTTSNEVNSGLSYNIGYEDGYNTGFADGSSDGYSRGVLDAGNYTFFSLIGAVIDAPISAFKSLFNFEFLGFNLLDFVTGLITLCFVIWIIRLIL